MTAVACPWAWEPIVAFNPNRPAPTLEIQLSPKEFAEVVEELYDLDLTQIVGPRPGLPRIRLFLECEDVAMRDRLNFLHVEYCRQVRKVIGE